MNKDKFTTNLYMSTCNAENYKRSAKGAYF